MPEELKDIYYDINKTMSRQRLFNFVVGPRGCGKTYGAKDYVIKRFLKYQEQFVYIRRYDTEFPSAEIQNFFDDIMEDYPDRSFKAGRGVFKIDNQIAGWYIALSKAIMLKSIPFPKVSLIIFDEFIIETGVHHYLPTEVRTFLECYSTVSRDRDIPALFLSNAITMSNPYFLYFNIGFEKGQSVYLTKHISAELIVNHKYIEHVNNTRFGQLIAETDYGKYAINNKFLLDTDTFMEQLQEGCSYICTVIISGRELGYYIGESCGKWWLSEKVDKTCPRKYSMELGTHTDETILAAKNNVYIAGLINHFCMGLLRFDTLTVKNIAINTLKKLM